MALCAAKDSSSQLRIAAISVTVVIWTKIWRKIYVCSFDKGIICFVEFYTFLIESKQETGNEFVDLNPLSMSYFLTIYQVKEYLRKEFERHGYPPNDTLHENMVADIFAKEDENKDGFISSREFTYKHDEL